MRVRHMVMLAMTIGCSAPSAQPSGPPAAAANDVLPFKATETTLPNGLRVIVVPTGFPNLVSVQVQVQTGSRNEVEPGKISPLDHVSFNFFLVSIAKHENSRGQLNGWERCRVSRARDFGSRANRQMGAGRNPHPLPITILQ